MSTPGGGCWPRPLSSATVAPDSPDDIRCRGLDRSTAEDALRFRKSLDLLSLFSDRAGVRTQDQRINLPHRLSPTAGPPGEGRVEGLDYLFAVAGVPRLVSEAEAGETTGPLPADYPIPSAFQTVTIAVAGLVVVRGALRASQHTAASTRRGSTSSRARLLFRGPGPRLKSVALPTELPGHRLSKTRLEYVPGPVSSRPRVAKSRGIVRPARPAPRARGRPLRRSRPRRRARFPRPSPGRPTPG